MPDRLDWDKARKRQIVSQRGADPADVTRFRAVPPSDADVEKLRALGYTGKRPATIGDVRVLIKSWAPTELGVTRREIDEVRAARGDAQKLAAAALFQKLENGYRQRLAEIAASKSKMKPSTPTRLRLQVTRAYEPLAQELRALAGSGNAIRQRPSMVEPPLRMKRATSELGLTDAELATLRALPVSLRQPRAEILWARVSERFDSKREMAMRSGSTRSRQARLRALFMEHQRARRAIFEENGLVPPSE